MYVTSCQYPRSSEGRRHSLVEGATGSHQHGRQVNMMNRREFLRSSSLVACSGSWVGYAASTSLAAQPLRALRKGACVGVLPPAASLAERFELARKAGFEGVEPNTLNTPEEVQEYKVAAKAAGIAFTSIMNSDHWKYPLTDNDPEVVKNAWMASGLPCGMLTS